MRIQREEQREKQKEKEREKALIGILCYLGRGG